MIFLFFRYCLAGSYFLKQSLFKVRFQDAHRVARLAFFKPNFRNFHVFRQHICKMFAVNAVSDARILIFVIFEGR